MAELTGLQPAHIQGNRDVTRVLIVKLNSIRRLSIVDGKSARAEIHGHLRTSLNENGWANHGKLPVVATKRCDQGDDQLKSDIEALLRRERGWARDRGLLNDHPGFQWTILRPLRFQREEDLNIAALFDEID
jgi:hypothetical protein